MLTTPKITGTLSATYGHDLAPGRVEATASVYHSGSYRWEYTGSVTTDEYTLLNGLVSFQPTGKSYKFSIYGKNLTNRAYVEGALPTTRIRDLLTGSSRRSGSARRELIAAIRGRYLVSTPPAKREILREFAAITGYHRKPAIRILNGGGRPGASVYRV